MSEINIVLSVISLSSISSTIYVLSPVGFVLIRTDAKLRLEDIRENKT